MNSCVYPLITDHYLPLDDQCFSPVTEEPAGPHIGLSEMQMALFSFIKCNKTVKQTSHISSYSCQYNQVCKIMKRAYT